MLKVNIKSKIYKMKNEELKALDNVNFELPSSGITCVLGPSGSGKTTLMNIIGSLDSNFEGDVNINNKSLKSYSSSDLDSYRKNTVGFIFQQFYLVNKLTAYDNVLTALNLSNLNNKKEKINELLKSVGMDKFSNRKVNRLSGGQKQRVAIARALANNPDIILADEPTGSLDSKTSTEVMEILKELSKTKLIVIVTHSKELASKYADNIINMQDGKILNIETINEIKDTLQENTDSNLKNSSKMSFFKAFGYSFKNIFRAKARTIATSIGLSFGIIGIGLALAMSTGTLDIAKAQISSIMPTNMIRVLVDNKSEDDVKSYMSAMNEENLFEMNDLIEIKNDNKNVSHFWPIPINVMESFFKEVSLNSSNMETAEIEGDSFLTNNGFEPYENVKNNLTFGTAPSNENEIVVSLNTAEYLKKESEKVEDIVGKTLYTQFGSYVSNEKNQILEFKIVGITSVNTMGHSMYQYSLDTLKLYEKLYNTTKDKMKISEAYLYLNDNLTSSQIEDIVKKLNDSSEKLKFVGAAQNTLSNVETVLNVVKNVLIGFSSISVIVAILMIGIVIYISVIERISEIGILRAIGAKTKDIRNIFLSESMIIGLLSGIIGVAITYGACSLINNTIVSLLNQNGLSMGHIEVAKLDINIALILVASCVILAIIAGVIPASKASKMDPIDALRRGK